MSTMINNFQNDTSSFQLLLCTADIKYFGWIGSNVYIKTSNIYKYVTWRSIILIIPNISGKKVKYAIQNSNTINLKHNDNDCTL